MCLKPTKLLFWTSLPLNRMSNNLITSQVAVVEVVVVAEVVNVVVVEGDVNWEIYSVE